MLFKLNARRAGTHVHVRVFAGEDRDHLALCGKLAFREHEWERFRSGLERADAGLVIEWR